MIRSVIPVSATIIHIMSPFVLAEEIRIATWPEYGKNAGIVVAQERGYFSDYGLHVTLIDTFQNGLILLEGGDADLAQVFCSAIIAKFKEGMAVRIIAARDQRTPVATVALPSQSIHAPEDYIGKRWGHSAGFSPERSMLEKILENKGSSIDSVDLVNLDFPARLPALLRGDVDFVSAWLGSGLPTMLQAARKNGQELSVVRWDEQGVDAYGECWAIKTNEHGNVPGWITPFLHAARKGYAYSLDNPAETLDLIRKAPKSGDPTALELSLIQGNELLLSKSQSEAGLLSVSREGLEKTAQWAGLPTEGMEELIGD
ncbi:ABC transporter substrate-binding protein [Paracoccus sp. CPCC 101403]|uniref:ABC transporter substrate-binding protein n=1 Tax=Paracoccus broussonetiae TaxID=3075834 RepID=A0ABU3EKP0_9RHOB|nr:ABC transporter substrate-binding protein [Paracoccus sp. CPCC 101403]MDT1064660.1 ABC transporter substrate-binding protein [Paracoccus sp. CPCC 101403]